MFILPIEEGKPPKRFPIVNTLLIDINIYVFYKTASNPQFEQIVWQNGFIPAHPNLRNAVSSMFMHAGLFHLLGNMYFLWVFGDNVEDRLGKFPYLLAYFLSGFGAIFLQYSVNPHSALPLIGASGAISGICALYMLMFPWNKMRLQFFFLIFPVFSIPVRAVFVVGFWFFEQYLMAMSSNPDMGGVAFWAHVGGFIAGIVMFPIFYKERKRRA